MLLSKASMIDSVCPKMGMSCLSVVIFSTLFTRETG